MTLSKITLHTLRTVTLWRHVMLNLNIKATFGENTKTLTCKTFCQDIMECPRCKIAVLMLNYFIDFSFLSLIV